MPVHPFQCRLFDLIDVLPADVSPAVGCRWFQEGGGITTIKFTPLSGRYLSFPEREEIAILFAQDLGVRLASYVRASPAGVSFEDRQDLLGHKSDRMTTHYSAPDIAGLIEAAERVCIHRPNTVLRIAPHANLTQKRTVVGTAQEDRL